MSQALTLSTSVLTPTGLILPTIETSFDAWWSLADHIRHLEARNDLTFKWLWGDWLRGLSRWPKKYEALTGQVGRGEGYKLLEAKTGKPFGTLKNLAWLAGAYSTDGRPDEARGLPHLYEIHFKVCAPIKNKPERDALLWRASTQRLTRQQLTTERLFLFPGLVRDEEEAQKPQDRQFEAEVRNHLLEAAVTVQGATLARLNGNVVEARGILEGIESDIRYGREVEPERVEQAVKLLEPVNVSEDVLGLIFEVIEAWEGGEVSRVLEGVGRLAQLKGALTR